VTDTATAPTDAPGATPAGGTAAEHHDVVVIGAGVCGIYMLYRLLEHGFDAAVLEAGSDVGGTWYWNRYPGARFDSESYTYGYSFSKELLEEWNWSEHFAAQPETLRYLQHVTERFSLRPHMRFGCRVVRNSWDAAAERWTVELEDGRRFTCRLLMTAIGLLSAATLPRYPGIETFQGRSFHTYNWPHEPVDFAGKRVAVIGTGATGVQVISAINDKVGSLTVFQRRPNWCAPLHNGPISEEEMADIKARYDEIFARCRETPGGFIHGPVRQSMFDVSEEERRAFWEELYASPGFGVWLGNYIDMLMDERANAEFTAFIADKIRGRVHDPVLAEKLIPKDHGFGTRRVPMETRYYEAYNRDNVRLVDINETPIVEIVPDGIRTTAGVEAFDIIIYATGFDAITGSFDRMEFVGTDGERLRDKWAEGPLTYLGVSVPGFPNLVTLAGPTAGSVSTNFPRGIEEAVDWAMALLLAMRDAGHTVVEATDEAEQEWTAHVKDMYGGLLLSNARSWMTGYNSNVEGHDRMRHVIYNGGAPRYRRRITRVAEHGYQGFVFA